MYRFYFFTLFAVSGLFIRGQAQVTPENPGDLPALKTVYRDFFLVGVAVGPGNLAGDESELILQQFNSLTAENVMKMGPIQPEENRFNWEPADRIVEFAQEHGLKMRGHTLCWHNQTPKWLFADESGAQVDKETLLARLKAHIQAVVGRYKGKVYAWDVVNEVIDDHPGQFYRQSPWYSIIGEEYIAKAFEYAHEADPDALLFYNDYNSVNPVKRDKIYAMLKRLLEAGVPVHGMGMQGHWSAFEPNETDLRAAIEKYASLGLQIQITELDVSIYAAEAGRRDLMPGEKQEFTPELERKQLEQYRMFFQVFREYKQHISSVTFWNVSDRRSWLDHFPVRGRKNYPLLFDRDLKPKKAFWEVVRFLSGD